MTDKNQCEKPLCEGANAVKKWLQDPVKCFIDVRKLFHEKILFLCHFYIFKAKILGL